MKDRKTKSNNNFNEVILVHENPKLFLVQQCTVPSVQIWNPLYSGLTICNFLLTEHFARELYTCGSTDGVICPECFVFSAWTQILLPHRHLLSFGISEMALQLELKDIRMFPLY
jgi:hypothetical protein